MFAIFGRQSSSGSGVQLVGRQNARDPLRRGRPSLAAILRLRDIAARVLPVLEASIRC